MSMTLLATVPVTPGESADIKWFGAGFVTGDGASFLFSLPMPRPIAGTPAISGKLVVRQGGRYLIGSGSGGTNVTLTVESARPLVAQCRYVMSSAPTGVTNNAPVGVEFLGTVTVS